ncbi:hypothetical protein R5031_32395 (plasmid) [Pseudomonas aeruginosa]|uniref:hypothetical protein n=1 Tax=Pseudomonas TaxID=286 RepID=UPI000F7DD593|nr:hypothetical protein [Pseudomonas aeruginosa]RTB38839.1 hypothetical protein EJ655_17330 [Pseudomonas aeruginosa]RTB60251.1 hypothetical protein EJ640_02135 [Pseudomonas aeruginosa]RTB85455.1 hypothetical protein EJ641_13850 [Pseudomonas aeruginosa]WOU23207.1 hypothetical protein R5031_32395 [Pseudomonas aeruginosa]WOU35755.1 hypothetical protein R5027_32415 [Pseudomonas aeruginosa]
MSIDWSKAVQPISDEQLAELADGCMDSIPCPISALYQLAERLRAAEAELSLWRPIMDEVERRAEKEWCLQDKRDFTVTIQYDDYVAIDSAMESTP